MDGLIDERTRLLKKFESDKTASLRAVEKDKSGELSTLTDRMHAETAGYARDRQAAAAEKARYEEEAAGEKARFGEERLRGEAVTSGLGAELAEANGRVAQLTEERRETEDALGELRLKETSLQALHATHESLYKEEGGLSVAVLRRREELKSLDAQVCACTAALQGGHGPFIDTAERVVSAIYTLSRDGSRTRAENAGFLRKAKAVADGVTSEIERLAGGLEAGLSETSRVLDKIKLEQVAALGGVAAAGCAPQMLINLKYGGWLIMNISRAILAWFQLEARTARQRPVQLTNCFVCRGASQPRTTIGP